MSARSYARDTMETLLIRSRTFADRRCFDLPVSPLPCRRTTSIIGDFLPLTTLRSRSALEPHATAVPSGGNYVMARNHVSVARFCDWSEDRHAPTKVSVSHLYREIAAAGGGQLCRSELTQLKKADGIGTPRSKNNARFNAGRMFLRDKGTLTKGEREIIEGIYKNRGDFQREGSRSDMNVRRHHEAWLVGKAVATNKAGTEGGDDTHHRGTLMEVTSPGVTGGEVPRLTAVDGWNGGGEAGGGEGGRERSHRGRCLLCLKEQHALQQLSSHHKPPRFHQSSSYGQWPHPFVAKETASWTGYDGALMTPPTTPERGCSPTNNIPQRFYSNYHPQSVSPVYAYNPAAKLLSRRQEPSSYGVVLPGCTPHSPLLDQPFPEETESSDSESQGSRKKVRVKVYLPKVGADAADEDITACMLQGRPVLARERHITQHDLKQKKLHKDNNNAETFQLLATRERPGKANDRDQSKSSTL